MKIAFVVPRYGLEIVGGAEYHARQVAEHLKEDHEIEVLTTCAKDYHTWKNEYKSGTESINGIFVRRFKNTKVRDINRHRWIEERVFYSYHDKHNEINWVKSQGPYSKELIKYIENNKNLYDCFIFFTFRYYPSYYGIQLVGYKSLLAPLAENDPALDLQITKEMFESSKGIVYNTPEERKLVLTKGGFREEEKIWDIVGCGIEMPMITKASESLMDKDYILYLGRIDGSKGCYTLFEYYQKVLNEFEDVPDLVLVGYDAIGTPKNDKIRYLGFVSEEEKFSLLRDAKFLIMPSPYESLSLVTLEAMASGIPALVNGECDVLKGHCIRSNAGLWYQNYDEFRECLNLLSSNEKLRGKMGENGKKYVEENYSWKNVAEKYLRLLEKMADSALENITFSALEVGSFDYRKFPLKLNLGCGFDKRGGYLNVDFQDFHKPDLVADIRNLNMLPSDTYDEILAQDCLEHLPLIDIDICLEEWYRLLKAGGKLKLRIPNLIGLLHLLEDKQSFEEQKELIHYLFGTQAYEGDYHLSGFTNLVTEHYLKETGFININFTSKDQWLFEITCEK